jgi:hypothetical protein
MLLRKLDICMKKSETRCMSSKWIENLNVKSKFFMLLQKRVGNTQEHIGIGNDILSRTQMVLQLRERIDK